ncbi:MAG TPA: PQQ-binding-like beta-propeller repeat protein [Candidatus Sulfopaludibacter sp.]|jgi:quinoprotein glucose dehydrogenase|nr:PQQ-binding-like beta-propeller repeat protein [Candidatus Sulfopaludibacter sp.]
MMYRFGVLLALAGLPLIAASRHDWPAYGGGPADIRYSDLRQVNRSNVGRLQMAWSYDTADGPGDPQTQPIFVDGVLYGLTPRHKVVALDGASGKLLWSFDSGIAGRGPNRSLVYWTDGKSARLFAAVQSFLYALDPHTGKVVDGFGEKGRIDLREGLGRDPAKQSVVLTSPGVIYKDLLIVGGRLPEALPAPVGDIRAFDVHTGKLRWSFHTIPHPGELGYETWPAGAWTYTGSANNWPGMAVDEKRGIVFAPTGSAASDFYGADRLGDNLFANSMLALKADTGERLWHFQAVKHDIWDRDFPSPPCLVTVRHDGKLVDAVAQTSKQGWVYLFDRATGKPLFPIEERRYPASTVPGEVASPMQRLPVRPAPYARQQLTADMLTNRTPEAHVWAVEQFRKLLGGGQFVPLSVNQETIIFPGFDGGAEWGGSAFDPETGLLYVNANDVPWTASLAEDDGGNSPRHTYQTNCANCHGDDLSGAPPQIPSLLALRGKRTAQEIGSVIRQGAGRMPAFPNLSAADVRATAQYILSGVSKELESTGEAASVPRYRFTGYHKFQDPDGYPAVVPPWGTLNAINLNTGEYAWKIPLGEYPELAAKGMKDTGTENYGGPIVTAGGLVFIAATNFDRKFRAFDKATGKLLWETTLPFSGNATPITYEMQGRQYIVIFATGGKSGARGPSGGTYVAFALK